MSDDKFALFTSAY